MFPYALISSGHCEASILQQTLKEKEVSCKRNIFLDLCGAFNLADTLPLYDFSGPKEIIESLM